MISRVIVIAFNAKVLPTATLALCSLIFSTCSPTLKRTGSRPSPTPTPIATSRVAFLFEGKVFTIAPETNDSKPVALGKDLESVDEFIWSADGKSIYLAIGLRLTAISIETGAASTIGVIDAPPGTTLDRLQPSAIPDVVIVHTSDADAAPHIYRFEIASRNTRELTIDEYSELALVEAPQLHGFSEISVSPDLMRVMFKTAVGANEELFVSDIETGTRTRLTALETIDGFEESVEAESGRRIINAGWSPDGRYILFNPAQSCSESGLCYGQLFMVDSFTGRTHRLSQGMMVGLDATWNRSGTKLLFEDDGKIFLSTTEGESRVIAEGNRPKWQPLPVQASK
jgi:Tol biopolymer transport system component